MKGLGTVLSMCFLLLPMKMGEYWYLAFLPTLLGIIAAVYYMQLPFFAYGVIISFLGSYLYIVAVFTFDLPL